MQYHTNSDKYCDSIEFTNLQQQKMQIIQKLLQSFFNLSRGNIEKNNDLRVKYDQFLKMKVK
jgi:hypothetical protein